MQEDYANRKCQTSWIDFQSGDSPKSSEQVSQQEQVNSGFGVFLQQITSHYDWRPDM